jgi:NodT family efflux transporter outer membrane factor (OMF) lipoprotein
MTRRALPSLLLLAALSGCVVGPKYEPPKPMVPPAWSAGEAAPAPAEQLRAFWEGFNDPALARLVQQAIDGNLDLQAAGERIRAADDAVRIAASGGLPQVSLGAAAEDHRQTQTLDIPPRSPFFGEYPFYQLGFNASWELDLFGETRHRKESAQAAAASAVEARRGVLVGLTATVATTYATLRATDARLRIARESLTTAQEAQTLAHRAYEAGDRSHLDVSQADARVHGLSATIPPLQAQSDNLVHALAILLGRAPEGFGRGDLVGPTIVPVAPELPASLPSEVIARRPDIRGAERAYAQANADVGVSVAGLYPHFSIPLSYGPTTSSLHTIFQGASLLWRVGLDAAQPLYSAGRLTANIDAARARRDAALLQYRQTVLKAFGEVEDALTLQAYERSRYQAVSAEVDDSRQAVRESRQRYGRGQVGLQPVLESERELFASQDAQVTSSLASCLAAISLYRAIGGGWDGVALAPQNRAETVAP